MTTSGRWFVRYSDDRNPPDDVILDINRGGSDINQGFGGKYVWLVPQWTQDPREACTYIGVDIRGNAVPNSQDLAAGAGGDYRYLVIRRDQHIQLKIQEVALYRKPNDHGAMNAGDLALILAQGYTNYSPDLNRTRGGDYLYLIWRRDYGN
ncbi:hypothetical protein F5Y00DRAFT_259152 [Daldinia vernicosa]|uniref:uncharacterized protein n=1 Tax=Daldinia vernicosa TaxID=114800 RepID=UPI002008DF00|nr:uncharacterized protein F5Y00DRAFT_259152 [Daldinia vernicosa]KAI0851664.1 hypothetical protein F5Y00DRAFT_259152 [Daldinia vernicosa]